MRCWTDGRRSLFLVDGKLIYHLRGSLMGAFPVSGEVDPYGPMGGLAVHPVQDVVYIAGDRVTSVRLDLETGQARRLEDAWADLAFDPSGGLVGVTASVDKEPKRLRGLARVDPETGAAGEAIPLTFDRRVRWPWGTPYTYGVYHMTFDGGARVRLTGSPYGLMMVATSGHAAVVDEDGARGWRFLPVYQGWAVGRLTQDGALLTTLHNGRCGDLMWLDRQGRWYDALDSEWNSLAPGAWTVDGVVCGFGQTLRWYEGSRAVADVDLGVYADDLAVAPDGRSGVFVGREGSGAFWRTEAGAWEVRFKGRAVGTCDTGDVDDGAPKPRWTWTTTGSRLPLSAPDPAMMGEWEQALLGADPDNLRLMLPELRAELPPWTGDMEALLSSEEPRAALWKPLLRDMLPDTPTRAAMRELARRRADPEASPFERYQVQALWPGPGGSLPAEVVDPLDAAVGLSRTWKDPEREPLPILAARLAGELDEAGVRWWVDLTLGEGVRGRLALAAVGPRALTRAPEGEATAAPATWRCRRSGAAVERELRVALAPVPSWTHEATVSDPGGETRLSFQVNVGPLRCRAPDVKKATQWLSRHVDPEGWYAATDDEGVALSPFLDDLEGGVPCGGPTLDPRTRAFLEALEGEGHLAWVRPVTEAEALEVQWALFGASAPALADALIELEALDDLFAGDDALWEVAARFRGGARGGAA